MEGKKKSSSDLPPGFRFHPTDEELIVHYLKNQVVSRPCPVSIIPEVDIYKFDPWQLPDKAEYGEKEWYFFTPRDRKYPNGIRPNRATVSGYWKATGTDKSIYSGGKYVGIKKALVFYKGRPPNGSKTDWIMHEYRLIEAKHKSTIKQHGSMRLDNWVLCRIYKKRCIIRTEIKTEEISSTSSQVQLSFGGINDDQINYDDQQQQPTKFPRTNSLSYLLDLDYLGPITHLLNDSGTYNSGFELQTSMTSTIDPDVFDPNVGPLSSYPNIGLSCQQIYGYPSCK
ncbi:hypothetical protein RND81_11G042600 [Saponaria officinalis]|uniref:NAC domain-containing protein n=1 Tax=Saponaria officinalis TaxID=3572 RepID=A0AAW1HHU8_SAPOF